ncbi:hypothetical protein C7974DRAFT_391750 [Boeremia exigua]|uniref:uncharacterized protein n=1 Tax=Boeremia exigua TaxID=749465 RepID=UPI001E8E1B83|nr:uncharacterized protein C7974DRAFT_391750 [Boeremia exigua]KAH6632899.1 hypothetical protein C7974DRAFT_391750 [Boeremia exigua]
MSWSYTCLPVPEPIGSDLSRWRSSLKLNMVNEVTRVLHFSRAPITTSPQSHHCTSRKGQQNPYNTQFTKKTTMADAESPRWTLVRTAIETDNTTLLDQAISMTPDEDLDQFFSRVCREAIKRSSTTILKSLIDRGVSVKHLEPTDVADHGNPPSKATLEFLLAHGWDINWRGYGPPFMWFMTSDADMIVWCLEHGASVLPSNQPWNRYGIEQAPRHCDAILEYAANHGNLEVFKLLRAKGAPLSQRVLHKAVETAAFGCDGRDDAEKQQRDRARQATHLELVRYLLDEVKLDVNAPDQEPGSTKGMSSAWGTPIAYVPGIGRPDLDSRELTWLLLDRGADPAPALEVAREMEQKSFLADVAAWTQQNPDGPKKAQSRDRSCSVQ